MLTRRIVRLRALCGVALSAAFTTAASDENVVLSLRAGNPLPEPQRCVIKQSLPAWFTTNDVVNLDGLALQFDPTNHVYCIQKSIDLGPREIASFSPVFRNIWTIRPSELKAFRDRVATAWGKLRQIKKASVKWTEYRGEIDADFIVFFSGLPIRGTNILDSVPELLPGIQERHTLTAAGLNDLERLESDRKGFERLKEALSELEKLIQQFERDPKAAWENLTGQLRYEPVVWAQLRPVEAEMEKVPNHTSEGIRRPADGSPKPSM